MWEGFFQLDPSSLYTNMSSWVSLLKSATLSVLPFDFVRPGDGKSVESSLNCEIPKQFQQCLAELAEKHKTIPFNAALAAYAILVFRLTGDEDIVIGSTTPDLTKLVLRVNITGETTFQNILDKTIETEEFAKKNPIESFTDLRTQLNVPLLYRTVFHAGDKTAVPANSGTDLVISFPSNDHIDVVFNSLLYKRERISIVCEQLFQIIGAAAKNSSAKVGSISLITPRQNEILPDPTTDLHWNDFGGAIQDIFARNAAKHPERACIVETPSFMEDGQKERTFSYKQIDEASNILAHHLVSSGVKLGDVVMVYAYRGVDLVVAVMGVLKAGAAFSVIDPAYPPARQNIYLSVAKPRALVILKKAGVLAPLVKEYIASDLDLLTTVPALELLDDGSLVGGDADGADVLHAAQALKGKQTGVVVGPDSQPTLSFTSGSEGIPKGVKGRHFSLTYYFPWMAQRFNLSENDKFTMLSGIAHDPIQRDIFTPLFLGAQLLVPTSDDIGTPGKLAEWMGKYGATVTHLTPAMGQLLSAQATAEIPSLHHAFFVGDILTKRDCLRLQSLARNVFIVNMYGTTETQRSVSYFEVASISEDPTFLQSQKDIMPAGKGMKDVQLLIVNRNDRTQTCGVGEVGEIYVRAGGLSAGYLKLPEVNREKFLDSWFVKEPWANTLDASQFPEGSWLGPRDRLYRTGDLGRYLPDGNTECSGRADDQVKIRGFRIELGEVDTHLSRHKYVRENITLVRRDKDEEPVLISYVVPQTASTGDAEMFSAHESVDEDDQADGLVKGLVKYRRLIKDIKTHLKQKLPSYAVPTVIVPLSKMPLNPNGKVDKPALPFPDTAQLTLAAKHDKNSGALQDQWTPMEAEIRDLWLGILPQRPLSVEPSDSFFDLGGHSILATRMIFELRKKMLIDVPLGLIFKEPTIAGFAKSIDLLKQDPHQADALLSQPEENKKDSILPYAEDAKSLSKKLPKYKPYDSSTSGKSKVVFLTGATGFLGSFIIRDLLERKDDYRIVAHVRAADKKKGLERIINSGIAFGSWKPEYESKVSIVIGNLEAEHFGLPDSEWNELCDTVDFVIHNGALVHWVYPYSTLRGPNVLATINVMDLCATGKGKLFTFVSSTSSIDTEHYVELSDKIVARGGDGVPESDDLQGSAHGLGNGYGQSKWAAEYIIRYAGEHRHLTGSIVRPGYIVGESSSGASSTDDFLLRMVKGCVELGKIPDIDNTVNMVPVDHVARLVVASGLHCLQPLRVVHVTGHPRLRFNEFLGALKTYGYKTELVDYIPWRISLEKYVTGGTDSALFPLLHFVLDNLPQSTKAPELDDINARICLEIDAEKETKAYGIVNGRGVDVDQLGIYFSYLVAIGFLPAPQSQGIKPLPKINLSAETLERLKNVGGRTK